MPQNTKLSGPVLCGNSKSASRSSGREREEKKKSQIGERSSWSTLRYVEKWHHVITYGGMIHQSGTTRSIGWFSSPTCVLDGRAMAVLPSTDQLAQLFACVPWSRVTDYWNPPKCSASWPTPSLSIHPSIHLSIYLSISYVRAYIQYESLATYILKVVGSYLSFLSLIAVQ